MNILRLNEVRGSKAAKRGRRVKEGHAFCPPPPINYGGRRSLVR